MLQTFIALQANGAAGGGMSGIIMIVVLIAIFYFMMIRPQQKKQKEIKKFRDGLQKGDNVITAGGICGKIVAADENYINLQIAAVDDKPVVITFQRVAIQAVLPKGTVKF